MDHVQITAAETLGVERRGGFYETAGALRDMIQSHVLQLTSLVAVEPPASFDANSVRNEKLKVLQSIRPFDLEMVAQAVVRGQYSPASQTRNYWQVIAKSTASTPTPAPKPLSPPAF